MTGYLRSVDCRPFLVVKKILCKNFHAILRKEFARDVQYITWYDTQLLN